MPRIQSCFPSSGYYRRFVHIVAPSPPQSLVLAYTVQWTFIAKKTSTKPNLKQPHQDVKLGDRFMFHYYHCRAAKGSVLLAIRTLVRSKRNQSVSDIFEDTVKRYPHKPMFLYGDDSWTFEKIESYANQVAQYFYTVEKFHKGDCVALVASTW